MLLVPPCYMVSWFFCSGFIHGYRCYIEKIASFVCFSDGQDAWFILSWGLLNTAVGFVESCCLVSSAIRPLKRAEEEWTDLSTHKGRRRAPSEVALWPWRLEPQVQLQLGCLSLKHVIREAPGEALVFTFGYS